MAEKTIVRTEEAPAPFKGAPYSQAIRAGELVFVSGQFGLGPARSCPGRRSRSRPSRRSPTGCDPRGRRHGLDRLVKTTVYLTTLDDFQGMNEVYARHVGDSPPARATVAVGLPDGFLVEIEAIALA